MLFLNVLKLNALFSFEFLVLILAIFLLAYVSKNKLNKWYRYLSICCVIVLAGIIICTAVNSCCENSWHQKRGCDIKKECHKGHGKLDGYHKGDHGKKRICPGKKAEEIEEEATEAVEE